MRRMKISIQEICKSNSENQRNRLLKAADYYGIINSKKVFLGDNGVKAIVVNKAEKEKREKKRQNERLDSIFSYIDNSIEKYIENGGKIYCEKGCCDCCKQYFNISIVEYRKIREILLKMPSDKLKEVYDLACAADNHLKDIDAERYNIISSSADDSKYNQVMYLSDDNVPYKLDFFGCPLCSEDGSCKAYKNRPIVCRLFGVIESMHGCEKNPKSDEGMPFDFRELGEQDNYGFIKDIDYVCSEFDDDGIKTKSVKTYFQLRPIFKWILLDEKVKNKI